MRSQVTSKRGDRGETVTIAGDTFPKSHPVLECCGSLDALRAQTALCRQLILASPRADAHGLAEFLLWMQHTYFLMGSQCNDPEDKHPEYRKMNLADHHLDHLEQEQARVEALARLPKQFIVGASNVLAAQIDVACITARRLERDIVRLKEAVPTFQCDTMLAYINRVSDYLFMLARLVEDGQHETVDYARLEGPR